MFETMDEERNIRCPRYALCLDRAARLELPGLGCNACPNRDFHAETFASLDDVPGCLSVLAAVFRKPRPFFFQNRKRPY